VSRTDEKLARIESAVETVNESVATAKSSQDEVVEQVDARLSEALASVRSGLAQQEQGRESMAADTRHLISEMAARVEALAEEANRTDRGLQALEIDAGQMRQDIDKVASYVEEVFQTRLGDTMQAFDGSVMDMLRGIRSELLRGVRSIEGISTVVAGGATTTKHLLAGSAEDREAPEGQDDGGELKPEADLGATEPQGEQDAEIPPPPQGEPTALHAWHSMAAASAQSS